MSVSVQTYPVSSTAPNSKVTKRYRNNNNSTVVPEQKGRKPPRHVVQLLKEVIINKRENASRNAAAAAANKVAAANGVAGCPPPTTTTPPRPSLLNGQRQPHSQGPVPPLGPGAAYPLRPRLPPTLSLPPRLQPPAVLPPRLPLIPPSPSKTSNSALTNGLSGLKGDVSPRSDVSLPPTPSPLSLPSPTTPSTPAPSTPSLLSPISGEYLLLLGTKIPAVIAYFVFCDICGISLTLIKQRMHLHYWKASGYEIANSVKSCFML